MKKLITEINLAVLLGGEGPERAVSLESGKRVLAALENNNIKAIAIDCPTKDLLQALEANEIDHCFIALHGAAGENGTVQALLDTVGVGYTGTGVLGSAIAMDKVKTKLIWQSIGIPTPTFKLISDKTQWSDIKDMVGNKAIIKPVSEGSSVGMSIVDNAESFKQAISLASEYGAQVMAEKWINGPEYTVSILSGATLPSIRLQPEGAFYDYHAKYLSDKTEYFCPSGLSESQEEKVLADSLQAFEVLGCKDYGRVDFMMDQSGSPYFLEVNTLPGLTTHSLLPMAAKAKGINFDQLILTVLEGSLDV